MLCYKESIFLRNQPTRICFLPAFHHMDKLFVLFVRSRIMETYKRIGYTKWVEVDTSGTQEESLNKTIEGLKFAGILS